MNELPRKLGNGICTGVFWEAIFVTEWLPKKLELHKPVIIWLLTNKPLQERYYLSYWKHGIVNVDVG